MLISPKYIGFDSVVRQLDATVSQAPGNIYLKNLEGKLLYCNDEQANHAGYSNYQQMIGLSDHEFPWASTADILRKNDLQVLHTQTPLRIDEYGQLKSGVLIRAYTQKKPYYHRNNLIGVWGTSVFTEIVNHSAKTIYINTINNRPLRLTKTQQQCIAHLLQGKTARQTANIMGLSIRTVENHIYAIRATNNISCLKMMCKYVQKINLS